jgi:predicted DNA-binding protein
MLHATTEMIRMSNKLKQVAVRFEPELLEKLEERAQQDRRPLASLIRKICHEATNQPEPRGVQAA